MRWGGSTFLLILALAGCAGAKAPPTATRPAASASCTDPEPASSTARLLAEGRITRAVAAFARVELPCKSAMGDAWGELVVAMAELGRAEEAKQEASAIAEAKDATPPAREAARRALGHLTRFAKAGGEQVAMLDSYDRALDDERAGQNERALAGFLEAWQRFRPNPQALIRAARNAKLTGGGARARRLYDRALAELAPTDATAVRARTWALGKLDSVWLSWLPGDRNLGLSLGDHVQILDDQTLEVLAIYRPRSVLGFTQSADGRRVAFTTEEKPTVVEVFHARSGHLLASLRAESEVQMVRANAAFTRLALATAAGRVEVFTLPEARRVAVLDAAEYAWDLAFLDDSLLWGAFAHGRRHFAWDVTKASELWAQTLPDSTDLARVDERLFYLSRVDKKRHALEALDLRSGRRTKPLLMDRGASDLAPLGRDSVAVAVGNKVIAFDASTLKATATVQVEGESVELRPDRPGAVRLRFWPRGKAGPVDRLWKPPSGELLPWSVPADALMDSFWGPAFSEAASGAIAYMPDADTLVVREPGGRERRLVRPNPADPEGVALVPDGSAILVGDDRGIRRLSLRSATLGWLGARGLPSANLGFTQDGQQLVATGSRVVVLDASTGAVRHQLERAELIDARITADGQQVVGVSADDGVVWDLLAGKSVTSVRDSNEPPGITPRTSATCCGGTYTLGPNISAIVAGRAERYFIATGWSGDGKRLGIAHGGPAHPEEEDGEDREDEDADDSWLGVLIVDTETRKVVRELSTKGVYLVPLINEVVLDHTGRRAAASANAQTVLWSVDDGKRFILGEGAELSFSRDGKLLVGLADSSAQIWRTSDGTTLGAFVLAPADPDSGAFIAGDGAVEWIGKPGSVHLSCLVGSAEVAFEVCEDRLVERGLVARTFR